MIIDSKSYFFFYLAGIKDCRRRGFSRQGESPRVIGPLSVSLTLIGATGCCSGSACITERSICADKTGLATLLGESGSIGRVSLVQHTLPIGTSYFHKCIYKQRHTPGSTGTQYLEQILNSCVKTPSDRESELN
jgi:hypothetical protein